ncbi:adenylate cyclase [Neorhodopirellula lusitana]|uniref:Adenylate cyclase n=1 Tax=Neorhodopirellula lusitana TaxID=445327 RepID=A0ABY1PYK8_9BACT|nr:adenylate/guanylate cyclase domain-containing protein [Neorhodopirellula lusitana]SMP53176.1 adenylate cyclase [Neorhodopirellula lusitana]
MPDLIAQSGDREGRWRRGMPELSAGRDVLLGREPRTSFASDGKGTYADTSAGKAIAADQPQRRHVAAIPWAVTWDASISRHHAVLTVLEGDRVRVSKDPRGRNPIFYRGQPRESFVLVPGEHFVIGQTTFTLAKRPGFTVETPGSSKDSNKPISVRRGLTPSSDEVQDTAQSPDWTSPPAMGEVTEMAFAASSLRKRNFRDTQTRIDLLARLPDLVNGSLGDEELYARVTDVLLRATPAATAVAIVKSTPGSKSDSTSNSRASSNALLEVLHYDVRNSDPQAEDVSTRLVAATLERRDSVLHLWDATSLGRNPSGRNPSAQGNDGGSQSDSGSDVEYTSAANVDWAFCVPLRSDACRGWVLYVTGSRAGVLRGDQGGDDSDGLIERLSDDVKFAEVVGSLVSGIRQANQFQHRHAAMRRFFAPVVLDAIAGTDSESWLKPRECDLSVMFCDLRGFSRTSEVHSDQLLLLLEQVSSALGVMTKHILETEGVIGDFHGDAAMGFWGWPLPLSGDIDPKVAATLAAAKAAACIRRDYVGGETEFRCGIGIASGPAVAGRIGTVDQVKVTAFGPVVNLASRLEGLTKIFGVEVLLDEVTASRLKQYDEHAVDDAEFSLSLRYLGLVRVAGIQTPVEIHQLVVPVDGQPTLTKAELQQSRQAWDAFIAGDWDNAYELLHRLPAWDRPKDVLLQKILQHHRVAPPDWDGVLTFQK